MFVTYLKGIQMRLFIFISILNIIFLTSCNGDDDSQTIINNYYYTDSLDNDASFTSIIIQNEIDTINISESPFYENPHDKLWAHRINTIEEMEPAFQNFAGVELDIYYESSEGRFDVRHHGELSGLSLRDYFKGIKNPNYYYYWIDFKNLQTDNQETSYKLLDEILNQFNIRENVIVEAVNPIALGYYVNREIFTSYWIPTVSNAYSNSNNQEAAAVKYWLKEYPFTVISADYRMYPYIKKYFPSQNIHLWVKSKDVPNGDEEARNISRELAKDPYVKVILVTVDDNFLL